MQWRLSLPSSIKKKKSQTHAFREHGSRKPPKSACVFDVTKTKNVHLTKTGSYNKDAQKKLTTIKVAYDEKGYGSERLLAETFGTPGSRMRVPMIGS